jgi:ubiquinone/menaquinone biosynthesis C-methylase UbiE
MWYDQKKKWDRIAFSFLNQCKNIIDVGCGQGRFIAQDKNRITGIDASKASLNKCKSLGYTVIESDVRQLTFEDNSVEGIHCSHVLEHFKPLDAHKILSEFDRVLVPKGVLVIRAPLLWYGFYSNLTHVKPYNPEAILHYLTPSQEHTMEQVSDGYKVLHLRKRFDPIVSGNMYFNTGFNFLNRWGFPWLTKSGFMLVLRKGC